MKKTVAIVVLFSVLFSICITGAYASSASITMDATFNQSNGTVTVKGNLSSGNGNSVTIKIEYPTGISYVNQIKCKDNGDFTLAYRINQAAAGTYKVYAGGSGIAEPATVQFTVKSASPGDGNGEENPPGDGNGEENPPGDENGGSEHDQGRSNGNATLSDKPVATGNRVTVKPRVENGVIKAVIDQDIVNTVVNAELRKQGLLIIVIGSAEGATNLKLELSAEVLRNAKSFGLKKLQIETQFATLVMSVDAIPSLGERARWVELSVEQIDAKGLQPAVTARLNGQFVYEFRLLVDGQPVSEFNGKMAMRVSFPYHLQYGENPNTIIVYYVTDKGQLDIVKNGRYDNQTGQVSFYAPHFSKYAANVNSVAFTDLASVKWAEDSIYGLSAREVVVGNGQGVYAPNRYLTRAEFVKMLIQGMDLTDSDAQAEFKDVSDRDWFYHEVASAVKLGIVKGY